MNIGQKGQQAFIGQRTFRKTVGLGPCECEMLRISPEKSQGQGRVGHILKLLCHQWVVRGLCCLSAAPLPASDSWAMRCTDWRLEREKVYPLLSLCQMVALAGTTAPGAPASTKQARALMGQALAVASSSMAFFYHPTSLWEVVVPIFDNHGIASPSFGCSLISSTP